MRELEFKNGALRLEGVDLERLARRFGTPLYAYSLKAVLENFRRVRDAFRPVDALVAYSAKANSNGAILRALAREGAGLDIVSGGELARGRKAGIPAERVIYAGVGKTEEEIAAGIRAGIRAFNIESPAEGERIAAVARRLKRPARAALRINPDVDAQTHHYITTGKKENKFGINFDQAIAVFERIAAHKGLTLDGLHAHIGSEILKPGPHAQALERLVELIEALRARGHTIRSLNLGGGFGIGYGDREKPLDVSALARRIVPTLKATGCEIVFEPGRSIVGNAGLLLTRVTYIKEGSVKRFAIVDAGMSDFIRPSLYDGYHRIARARAARTGERRRRVDVVGPICESGDFFAKDRLLPPLEAGDLLAVLDTGAYGMAMASHYNSRPLPAEALVRGSRAHLIRERETMADLTRRERIPDFLR
jgi:diaminopimelate decarboxylase